MKSIKQFFEYIVFSHKELLHFFKDYRLSMLGLFLINLTVMIDWKSAMFMEHAYLETPLSFIVVLLNMYLIVNVLMIEKSKFLNQEKEHAFYNYPSFVIYTLYSGLIVIVIPFIIIGLDRGLGFNSIISMFVAGVFAFLMSVIVSMCPVASVLIDNDYENYFKVSLRIARKYFGVLVLYTILTLLSEVPDILFTFIEDATLKSFSGLLYAVWDSYVLILVAKVGVKIFYGLYRNDSKIFLLEK